MAINNNYENIDITEYLNKQSTTKIKAAGIITEKQLIIGADMAKTTDPDHRDIINYLESQLYPECCGNFKKLYDKEKDQVVLGCINNEMVIYMPENKNFSNQQYIMLSYILLQVKKYNDQHVSKMIVASFGFDKNGHIFTFYDLEIFNLMLFLKTQIMDCPNKNKEATITGLALNDIKKLIIETNNKK